MYKIWKKSDIFLCFLFYSMLGWIYEVLLGLIKHNGFVNRGFLFGPYCPVYGFGSLLFLILLYEKKDRKLKIKNFNIRPIAFFLCIILLTTIVELITSYLMEFVMGEWLWDYSNYFLNFQGRIAMHSSIRFGIGGIIIIYSIQPLLEKVNLKKYKKLRLFLMILFLADIAFKVF